MESSVLSGSVHDDPDFVFRSHLQDPDLLMSGALGGEEVWEAEERRRYEEGEEDKEVMPSSAAPAVGSALVPWSGAPGSYQGTSQPGNAGERLLTKSQKKRLSVKSPFAQSRLMLQ